MLPLSVSFFHFSFDSSELIGWGGGGGGVATSLGDASTPHCLKHLPYFPARRLGKEGKLENHS